jgi:serine/threonine protein phosphatase PrpC
LVRFDVYTASNSVGPGHSENQDSYLADISTQSFAVADGVGGYAGGKEASQQAVMALRNKAGEIQNDFSVKSVLEEIHEQLLHTAKSMGHENMGTTISVVKVLPDFKSGTGGKIVAANVGDSPILLFPGTTDSDSFEKISVDDSLRDKIPGSMFGIIQYLGIESRELDVHSTTLEYHAGDIVLLCSDGVSDNLLGDRVYSQKRGTGNISELVRRHGSAQMIVEEALRARIKTDDMTALLIFL